MKITQITQEGRVLFLGARLFVAFSIFLNGFISTGNLSALLKSLSILGIMSLGMALVVIGRGVDFSMVATPVTGMFGLVGAGRTETMKIVVGVLKRDLFHGREIRLNDRPARYRVPGKAISEGIVYITEDRSSKASSRL